MFMYPMGEESNSPITPYKSAEVTIDVDSENYEEDEVVPTSNDLYKRVTKQWVLAQELAGLTVYTSGASLLFLILRSIDWFVVALVLSGLALLGVGLIFFAWGQLKTLDRFRLFASGVGTGFAAAISGSDLMLGWLSKNQQLAVTVLVGFLVVVAFVGVKFVSSFLLKRKRGF
jgi:hypothetical protein